MGYFYPPFWILLFALAGLAGLVFHFRPWDRNDIQIWILVAAVGMATDMLLCKQYHLYYFVSRDFMGWYSFWAELFMNPLIGIIFVKLLPQRNYILPYIGIWTGALLLLEVYIGLPYGIVHYPNWRIIPWSVTVYILSFGLIYRYYLWLKELSG